MNANKRKVRPIRRLPVAILAAILVSAPFTSAWAAEYDTFSSTPQTWSFASPSGNTSDEPSGLGASRKDPGSVLWANEAPRNGMGMLYAVNSGGLQKTFKFQPTGGMFDFEDMAIGPCNGANSGNCVWVGDIGRICADFSASKKNTFWLYRMAEPDISGTANNTTLAVTGRFGFTVPAVVANEGKKPGGSTWSYDMEALMVHPVTGEIFVVTKGKNNGGLIRIMKYPGALTTGETKELQIVKTYQMPRAGNWNPTTLAGEAAHLVTGADIHPDGRRFILRTYSTIWEFRGSDFAAALASTSPVKLPRAGGALDSQGEAVAYSPDGARYYTIAEKSATVTRKVVFFQKQ